MKILISESQLSEIIRGEFDEVRTRDKPMVGSGASHTVYPSRKYPNMVYKIGSISTVNKWYEMFSEFPEIFPKVYKKGVTMIQYYNEGRIKVSYVLLEKLDTKTFEDFWDIIDEYFEGESLQMILMNFEFTYDKLIRTGDVIKKNEGEEVYRRYMELINMVDTIIELVGSPDIHKFQFGYDGTGKLKCLDI